MLVWWSVLFTQGVIAFLDGFLDFGAFARQVNSAIFLLVSLGLLARITMKIREGSREQLVERVEQLKRELQDVKSARQPIAPEPAMTIHRPVHA